MAERSIRALSALPNMPKGENMHATARSRSASVQRGTLAAERVSPGDTHGLLTVVGDAPRGSRGAMLVVKCACGAEKNIARCDWLLLQSCGCKRAELCGAIRRSHGLSRSPEYNIWNLMKQRCGNPSAKEFKYYGGRGIRVCARWRRSFSDFLADIGTRPSHGFTLDRVDNDGHYEPGNCRWATKREQAANRRSSKPIRFEGARYSSRELGKKLGCSSSTICFHLRRGIAPSQLPDMIEATARRRLAAQKIN